MRQRKLLILLLVLTDIPVLFAFEWLFIKHPASQHKLTMVLAYFQIALMVTFTAAFVLLAKHQRKEQIVSGQPMPVAPMPKKWAIILHGCLGTYGFINQCLKLFLLAANGQLWPMGLAACVGLAVSIGFISFAYQGYMRRAAMNEKSEADTSATLRDDNQEARD